MDKYAFAEPVPKEFLKKNQCLDPLLTKLLHLRGIDSERKIEAFLNPSYDNHLHDPFLFNDMDLAVQRILDAIKQNEKVLIYSDYDSDGIPGAVILHDFFKEIGFENFENYIPHRHNDGFGLNMEAVQNFSNNGVKLIITIDCGTADTAQIEKAVELGIDVIVTDHHEPNGKVPKAIALINPKRRDSTYPFQELCGAAVVYKLVQALIDRGEFAWPKEREKWLLDMAGLATLSDMVPLIGENRIFAYFGLKVLRKSRRPGLRELLYKLRINQNHLTEDDITFMLTPRINAASRMGSAEDAFLFLSTKNFLEAKAAADRLNKTNDERKGVVASIVKEIKHRISQNDSGIHEKAVVIGNPSWRPSLLGLVANSLVEDFKRPVFLWGRDGENMIKGSCRSDGFVDVLNVMNSVKDCFLEFGGHKMAGGFSVDFEKIHHLPEKIFEACSNLNSDQSQLNNSIVIDGRLNIDDLNWETFETIEKMAPFGIGNPKPIFLLENLEIDAIKKFGKEGKHLRISFSGTEIEGICFFAEKEKFGNLAQNDRVDTIASLEKSVFRHKPELRLRVLDLLKR